MPFESSRQLRWMFANKPEMAHRWIREARSKGEPIIMTKRGKNGGQEGGK